MEDKETGIWIIPKEVMFLTDLSLEARCVYGVLWTRRNGDAIAWPGQKYIAEMLGVGERSIRRYLEELKEAGLIEVERQGLRKTNRYILTGQIGRSRPATVGLSRPATVGRSHSKSTVVREHSTLCDAPTAVAASEEKKSKGDEPMDLRQFLEWTAKSPQRHINAIGVWAEVIQPDSQTRGQWNAFISRHLRPAKQVAQFSDDQIQRACQRIQGDQNGKYLTRITLETLLKYLTN